jgi:putative copper export protein
MARSGSLPWLVLAAVICTLLAIFLESAFLHPVTSALMGTEVWQTSHNSYAYAGKQMVADFVGNLLTVIALGIWIGVLIDARRAV